METSRPQLIILADSINALCPLFGISLLERLLRIVERIGFRDALILTNSKAVEQHLATPSWARAKVVLKFRQTNADPVRVTEILPENERTLLVSAGLYYDARLLQALSEQQTTT